MWKVWKAGVIFSPMGGMTNSPTSKGACLRTRDHSAKHVRAIDRAELAQSNGRCRSSEFPNVGAPPIYDRAREVWVGGSTAITIAGNKFAAGLGDHYLGRTGFGSQQTKERADPGRPDNLFEPIPGDRGAHGRFDNRAHGRSLQLFAVTRRRALLAAAGVVGAVVGFAVRPGARSHKHLQ
jgi:hypothetical protein